MNPNCQLITFKKEDRDNILHKLSESQSDGLLKSFLNLSAIIDTARVMLPIKFKPILERLSTSYSQMNKKMKDVLSGTCAASSRFAIESMEVLEHGMMKEHEQASLIHLRNTLNSKYGNELLVIFNEAREDLVDIHSILLIEASGSQLEHLLDKSAATEKKLQQRSNDLTAKASEIDRNQDEIDFLQYELQTCATTIKTSKETKDKMKTEIEILKAEQSRYEAELNRLQHIIPNLNPKDWHFIFVHDLICKDVSNQERIARENVNRLHERINDSSTKLRNWSVEHLEKQESEARVKLSSLTEKQKVLNQQYANLQTAYNTTKEECDEVSKEIQDIYQKNETNDVERIKMVDTFAHSIQNAAESLITAYGKIKTHLGMIDTDPDILVDSIVNALDVISIGDQHSSTDEISHLQRMVL